MTTTGGTVHGGEEKRMVRAVNVLGPGWAGKPADTVVLGFDDRHRRRLAMEGTRGLAFLLDLEQVVALRGGDALVLEDGRLVEVVAAPEPLIEIRGSDPQHLVRIAWHLGNRHLPTQITPRGLRIRRDHVIADMVRGLGGRVVEIEAPFDPEGGAYTSPATPAPERSHHHAHPHGHHGHDHDPHDSHRHDHGHAHDDHHHHEHHGHDHHGHAEHDHDHGHGHGHDNDHCHDGACGHDHAHDQSR